MGYFPDVAVLSTLQNGRFAVAEPFPGESKQRRHLLQSAAVLALPALASLPEANAQNAGFPARPIKLIVAFPAGGPTDITMRSLADNASKTLGQPVIVENKPGAGGTPPAQ